MAVTEPRRKWNPKYLERTELRAGRLATPCRIWTGKVDKDGYPAVGGAPALYVRLYEATRGPVPPGHQVHHRCQNKTCLAEDHLEDLSRSANWREQWAAHHRQHAFSQLRVARMLHAQVGRAR